MAQRARTKHLLKEPLSGGILLTTTQFAARAPARRPHLMWGQHICVPLPLLNGAGELCCRGEAAGDCPQMSTLLHKLQLLRRRIPLVRYLARLLSGPRQKQPRLFRNNWKDIRGLRLPKANKGSEKGELAATMAPARAAKPFEAAHHLSGGRESRRWAVPRRSAQARPELCQTTIKPFPNILLVRK